MRAGSEARNSRPAKRRESPAEGGPDGFAGDDILRLAESKARREHFKALADEAAYRRQLGELVDAAAVRREAFELGRALQESILSVPDRIAAEVAAEGNVGAVHKILTAELVRALAAVASPVAADDVEDQAAADPEAPPA